MWVAAEEEQIPQSDEDSITHTSLLVLQGDGSAVVCLWQYEDSGELMWADAGKQNTDTLMSMKTSLEFRITLYSNSNLISLFMRYLCSQWPWTNTISCFIYLDPLSGWQLLFLNMTSSCQTLVWWINTNKTNNNNNNNKQLQHNFNKTVKTFYTAQRLQWVHLLLISNSHMFCSRNNLNVCCFMRRTGSSSWFYMFYLLNVWSLMEPCIQSLHLFFETGSEKQPYDACWVLKLQLSGREYGK